MWESRWTSEGLVLSSLQSARAFGVSHAVGHVAKGEAAEQGSLCFWLTVTKCRLQPGTVLGSHIPLHSQAYEAGSIVISTSPRSQLRQGDAATD